MSVWVCVVVCMSQLSHSWPRLDTDTDRHRSGHDTALYLADIIIAVVGILSTFPSASLCNQHFGV